MSERKTEHQKLCVEQVKPAVADHQKLTLNKALCRDNVLYNEVVGGLKISLEIHKTPTRTEKSFSGFCYQLDVEDRNRLKRYYTGRLKENNLWIDVGNNILEANG